MDKDTIIFLTTVIGCGIGVGGFILGMTARAKQDGQLLAKIGFCVDGISEIKKQIAILSIQNVEMLKETATQDNRLLTVEREIQEIKRRIYGDGQGSRQ